MAGKRPFRSLVCTEGRLVKKKKEKGIIRPLRGKCQDPREKKGVVIKETIEEK